MILVGFTTKKYPIHLFWPITEKIREKFIERVLSVFRRYHKKYEEFNKSDVLNQKLL